MNIAEIPKRAAVRKVVYVLVALALAWIGVGLANAQETPDCTNIATPQTYCPDVPAAAAALESFAAQMAAQDPRNVSCGVVVTGTTARLNMIRAGYSDTCPTGGRTWIRYTYNGCPDGTEWNAWTSKCDTPCSQRDPLAGGLSRSADICSGGCRYTANGFATTLHTNGGPLSVFTTKGATPTGVACTVGEPDNHSEAPQECLPVEGQSMCLKPNGDHCYSASSGRQICWKPGETGEKTDQNMKQKRDPGDQPQPPTPPDNGDTLVQEGQPLTTTTVDGTGRTITTTTTNYSTGSGADAGSGNSGQPGDGSGEGEGDDDEDNGGEVGGGVGDLYEGDDKTVESVITDFHNRMKGSPLIGAATGFFAVQGGGSCPTFTLTMFGNSTNLDFFCMAEFQQIFYWIGWFVLAMFTWKAFEVGFG